METHAVGTAHRGLAKERILAPGMGAETERARLPCSGVRAPHYGEGMTDPTPDPETVRVTYAELAKARSVSIAAARKLVLRHRWHKQIGNDGLTHVLVPVSFMEDGGKDVPSAFDEAVIAAIAEATA